MLVDGVPPNPPESKTDGFLKCFFGSKNQAVRSHAFPSSRRIAHTVWYTARPIRAYVMNSSTRKITKRAVACHLQASARFVVSRDMQQPHDAAEKDANGSVSQACTRYTQADWPGISSSPPCCHAAPFSWYRHSCSSMDEGTRFSSAEGLMTTSRVSVAEERVYIRG